MNTKIIKSLYKKELLDVIRDKKTVIMMLIVPLVLYPVVMILSMQLMTGISETMSTSNYRICLDFEDNTRLKELFEANEDVSCTFEFLEPENPEAALANEELDVIIRASKNEDVEQFDIVYMSSVTMSAYAVDMVERVLVAYKNIKTKELLEAAGLDPSYILNPVVVSYKDTSTNEETAGSLLGLMIPFMLVISLLMGTMYPAIDTTAGERERGTLETILTLPVTNKELITSKFLAVGTIGIISALLNIISMGGVGAYMYNMVSSMQKSTGTIKMSKFGPAILVGVLCVLAFAVFISAISMCVCALAKSYKEANNYLTPLTLIVMFASFISFIPNVNLNGRTALIPVANVCLLIKELLQFKYNINMIALVLFANVSYGVISIMILSRIYDSETILFGDSNGGIQIFEKRSNIKKSDYPTTSDVWLVVIILAMLVIYLGGALQLKFGIGGVLGTQLIIAGVAFLAAVYTKKDLRKTFKLRLPSLRGVVGGIIAVAGGIMLSIVLSGLVAVVFSNSSAAAEEATLKIIGDNPVIAILVVALAPAICEELMFRGYILGAMTNKYKIGSAITVAAIIFGMYHMSVSRFFPTALLGALQCYFAVKTESILPGMIMHFINNALSVVTVIYPEKVAKILPIMTQNSINTVEAVLLAIGGVVFIAVGVLFVKNNSKKQEKSLIC